MPYQDGTGPNGNGSPGRGLGPCGRFGTSARDNFGPRLGRGFGRGLGRGRRAGFGGGYGPRFNRCYDGPVYVPQETAYAYTKEDLRAQKDDLERQLQWLTEQLAKEDKD